MTDADSVRELYPAAAAVIRDHRGRREYRIAANVPTDPCRPHRVRVYLCKWCRSAARAWRAAAGSVWTRHYDRLAG